jgi:hypothetical protein
MQGVIDLLGQPDTDTVYPGDILYASPGKLPQSAELLE